MPQTCGRCQIFNWAENTNTICRRSHGRHTHNSHYSRVSTDADYVELTSKLTSETATQDYISEWTIFKVLDTLRLTSTGLDSVPVWFLRLGAAVFSKPLSYLFNQSLATSIVPLQWKRAIVCPVHKTATPKQCSDFRPISVTPILTRIMERIVVQSFLYPALLTLPPNLTVADQYAFRPTGPTTAALI